jgi:hypothetical protein
MSKDKNKQLKIKFDHDWYYCCLPSTKEDIDINVMTNSNNNDDYQWTNIHLPHIIPNNEEEEIRDNNPQNWWYRKQFQWEASRQNLDDRCFLMFESLNDNVTNKNNNKYSSVNTFTVWLNEIQIFSNSFQSPNISIDLTEHIVYKDESEKTNEKNTLIVCCNNASLSLHVYLRLPRKIAHAIEQECIDVGGNETSNTLLFRQNRVLDYLVGLNDVDGLFDVGFNPKLKSPTPRKQKNLPDIVISEDDDPTNQEKTDNKEHSEEEFHVPRLAIVMLVVGTRGDVQPFVA